MVYDWIKQVFQVYDEAIQDILEDSYNCLYSLWPLQLYNCGPINRLNRHVAISSLWVLLSSDAAASATAKIWTNMFDWSNKLGVWWGGVMLCSCAYCNIYIYINIIFVSTCSNPVAGLSWNWHHMYIYIHTLDVRNLMIRYGCILHTKWLLWWYTIWLDKIVFDCTYIHKLWLH